MKAMHTIAMILVIVGALNWGLVGIAGFDLVATLFGAQSVLASLVYILVGAGGVLLLVRLATSRRGAVSDRMAVGT